MKPLCLVSAMAIGATLVVSCARRETTAVAGQTGAAAPAPAAPVARDGDRDHPIPLQQALADGVCEVQSVATMAFNSRFVLFALRPRVKTGPWILIEPGWSLKSQVDQGAHLTVRSAAVQLYAQNARTVSVPAIELAKSHRVPVNLDWSRLPPGDPLASLVRAGAQLKPPPAWAVFQTAALVLTRDIDFAAMRRERFSASRDTGTVIILGDAGGNVLDHFGTIERTNGLLLAAGHDPLRFRLFREAEAAYAKALADWRGGTRADLQALYALGFFRTRPEAFAILGSVWTTRPADKKYYREAAIRQLGEGLVNYGESPRGTVDPKFREALAAALAQETDPKLQQEIRGHLARAEKAAQP